MQSTSAIQSADSKVQKLSDTCSFSLGCRDNMARHRDDGAFPSWLSLFYTKPDQFLTWGLGSQVGVGVGGKEHAGRKKTRSMCEF